VSKFFLSVSIANSYILVQSASGPNFNDYSGWHRLAEWKPPFASGLKLPLWEWWWHEYEYVTFCRTEKWGQKTGQKLESERLEFKPIVTSTKNAVKEFHLRTTAFALLSSPRQGEAFSLFGVFIFYQILAPPPHPPPSLNLESRRDTIGGRKWEKPNEDINATSNYRG
jgi:hypothetical protein